MKRLEIICLILIVVLAAALRFYKITINPPHLYWDEASIAYNAYSVNQTGKDEWGENNPFLFKSFGDYKLPLYIYVVALSQRLFGLTDFAVRFPSALAGVLTVATMFWLVKEELYLVGQKYKQFPFVNHPGATALLAAFLLAISPWALQFSRAGFEANLALFCRGFALLFFLLAIRKNIKYLFASFFFFAASVYTYHSAAISAPLILLVLLILFRQELLVKWKTVVVAGLFLALLILPYLPSYVFSAHGRVRATSESVLHMEGNPMKNFVDNYVANFSLDYLFFHGDQGGRHSVKKLGELYLWQLPAVLAGLYFLLRYRSRASVIMITWVLIAALPVALTRVSPHALRGLLAVRSWQTITAIGVAFLLWKTRHRFSWMLIPIVLYSFLLYLHLYYIHYPRAYAADWQDGRRQTIAFVKSIEKNYDKIYVGEEFEPIYIWLYWPIDPKTVQESGHNNKEFGKFVYFNPEIESPPSLPGQKSLIIAPPWFTNPKATVIRQIKMVGGEPVFNVYDF